MGEPATAKRPGFSARLELDGLEPLVTLVRRLSYHAELRVRTEDGGVGLLRYSGGELAGGVFDGAYGPLALERLLALRSGAVELEVLSSEPALLDPTVLEPTDLEPPLPAPAPLDHVPSPAARHEPATPRPARARRKRRVEATSAFVEPSALRSWLWALAPGLALALWLAVELAQHLSSTQSPAPGPGAPAARSAPRPPGSGPK